MDIEKLADLARMEITLEEKKALEESITSVLAYVDQIQSVDAGGSMAEGDAEAAVAPHNVLRPDAAPHESGAYTEAILADAPETKDQYIKVKKIL